MKTIIALFILSVATYGSMNAQTMDRNSTAPIKKEITQTNSGPTLLEIKDGNVMVNGEVVSTIADRNECLRLKINTECVKPAPVVVEKKVVATCNPCQRRRSSCNSCRGSVDRYSYYDDRSFTGYRQTYYGGGSFKYKGCGCRSHSDW
jgi:hypothetical protein